MEISIVILNYKMRGLVKNCIKAIYESEINVVFEIIVVDNNSNDGVEQMLNEKYPNVQLIHSSENLGMGGGNNLGIKQAQGKYVLIMNPDIFVSKNSIQNLYNYIKERADVGVVSPKLLNPDGSLQKTCYRWHKLPTPIYRRTFLGKFQFAQLELERFLMSDWDHNSVSEVDWLQGSCLLIPKKVLDEHGSFDERFFMYFEDTDLCRRIKKAGYKNIYHAETKVIHLHRRQSADGGGVKVLFNKLTRVHIYSWIKYLYKWREDEK